MALYAIGDLHLSFGSEKPMDIFGKTWENHAEKLRAGFSKLNEDDLCVLCGDLSWGMDLEDALEDFLFIDSLPGKKLIVKGNHDYWWSTASKAKSFFAAHGIGSIDILHNNSFQYRGLSICGTRGWFCEEEQGTEHDRKIMLREIGRLRASLDSAQEGPKSVFLHYPPVYLEYRCEEILDLLRTYDVKTCCYGHLHAKACRAAFKGVLSGTEFKLVSADYLNFEPMEIVLP